jgi:hypothetical protein
MTPGSRFRFLIAILATAVLSAAQPQASPHPEQSPRQAILEMLSGNEDKFQKHLTPEVQQKLADIARNSTTGGLNPGQWVNMVRSANGEKLDTFETGRILFAINNSAKHERLEVHVVGEDQRGDEDDMELSIHRFQSGVEDPTPVALRFLVSMKLQEGLWRLNALTVSARLPLGDPRIFDKSFWTQASLATAGAGALPSAETAALSEPAKMKPMRAVRMITLAEDLYAQKHPQVGFTCELSELVNIGKGLDNGETYRFMDPAFAGGVYNGYRFALRACDGNPAKTFQVMAEPVNSKGKAYCSDDRHNLRSSDDGQGTSCLTSGTLARQ